MWHSSNLSITIWCVVSLTTALVVGCMCVHIIYLIALHKFSARVNVSWHHDKNNIMVSLSDDLCCRHMMLAAPWILTQYGHQGWRIILGSSAIFEWVLMLHMAYRTYFRSLITICKEIKMRTNSQQLQVFITQLRLPFLVKHPVTAWTDADGPPTWLLYISLLLLL